MCIYILLLFIKFSERRGKIMTKKEKFMLDYLIENSNYANGNLIEYISPTEIGRAYGLFINKL